LNSLQKKKASIQGNRLITSSCAKPGWIAAEAEIPGLWLISSSGKNPTELAGNFAWAKTRWASALAHKLGRKAKQLFLVDAHRSYPLVCSWKDHRAALPLKGASLQASQCRIHHIKILHAKLFPYQW